MKRIGQSIQSIDGLAREVIGVEQPSSEKIHRVDGDRRMQHRYRRMHGPVAAVHDGPALNTPCESVVEAGEDRSPLDAERGMRPFHDLGPHAMFARFLEQGTVQRVHRQETLCHQPGVDKHGGTHTGEKRVLGLCAKHADSPVSTRSGQQRTCVFFMHI